MSKIKPATDEQLAIWERGPIYNDDLRFAITTLIARIRIEQEARATLEEKHQDLIKREFVQFQHLKNLEDLYHQSITSAKELSSAVRAATIRECASIARKEDDNDFTGSNIASTVEDAILALLPKGVAI